MIKLGRKSFTWLLNKSADPCWFYWLVRVFTPGGGNDFKIRGKLTTAKLLYRA